MPTIEIPFGEDTIIVRAYRQQPVRLHAEFRQGKLLVWGDNKNSPLGWKIEDAFSDGDAEFEALNAAWKSGDEKAIAAAWKQAKRLTALESET